MPFEPTSFGPATAAPAFSVGEHRQWTPILQHGCDFNPAIFDQVSTNLIKNPNINSTHLFRADILYDSHGEADNAKLDPPMGEVRALLDEYSSPDGAFPGFQLERTIIRRMIPRNPQLDRPIAQTCELLRCLEANGVAKTLVVYIPHAQSVEELPWYHPSVKSMLYLHTWTPEGSLRGSKADSGVDVGAIEEVRQGTVSLHVHLFPSQSFPLPDRLLRTAHHLLAIVYKHGQGLLGGYAKKVHHDQVISQQSLQDTYAELKARFAKPLCDRWVEQTESSKHVFEDIGIAAFLIELWKGMYSAPKLDDDNASRPSSASRIALRYDDRLPRFPGFVDIGCGNGVLVEILLQSGYPGWGFDARRRKTWAILSPDTRANLHQMILVPKPLFDLPFSVAPRPKDFFRRALHTLRPPTPFKPLQPPKEPWHNGVFPDGTFIISNHADELTPWTPLLASLSQSPFLAIPCCSHNLSGLRFRAPSLFNSLTADTHAPAFFAANKRRAKSVPISLASNLADEDDTPAAPRLTVHHASSMPSVCSTPVEDEVIEILLHGSSTTESTPPPTSPPPAGNHLRAETGSLMSLAPSVRAKLPSAYSSLCDWVGHLASEVGYVVEREALRIPSTRNVGILGRVWRSGYEPPRMAGGSSNDDATRLETERKWEERGRAPAGPRPPEGWGLTPTERGRLVRLVMDKEGADGRLWIERCRGLAKGRGKGNKKDMHG